MNQLLKLDGISGEGDVKLQRKMQVYTLYSIAYNSTVFYGLNYNLVIIAFVVGKKSAKVCWDSRYVEDQELNARE